MSEALAGAGGAPSKEPYVCVARLKVVNVGGCCAQVRIVFENTHTAGLCAHVRVPLCVFCAVCHSFDFYPVRHLRGSVSDLNLIVGVGGADALLGNKPSFRRRPSEAGYYEISIIIEL